jgi:hypothetical protein
LLQFCKALQWAASDKGMDADCCTRAAAAAAGPAPELDSKLVCRGPHNFMLTPCEAEPIKQVGAAASVQLPQVLSLAAHWHSACCATCGTMGSRLQALWADCGWVFLCMVHLGVSACLLGQQAVSLPEQVALTWP